MILCQSHLITFEAHQYLSQLQISFLIISGPIYLPKTACINSPKTESNLTLLTTVADIIQSQSILIRCHDTNSLWLPHLRVKHQSKGKQLMDSLRTET